MSRLLEAIARHAAKTPQHPALVGAADSLGYAALLGAVELLADRLRRAAPSVLGICADNGVDWAVADLAAHAADIPVVPIPPFFTPAQAAHVIRTAGIDQVLSDNPAYLSAALEQLLPAGEPFYGRLSWLHPGAGGRRPLPAGTAKVTFTSGTTGEPKGVCLGSDEMITVAGALCRASDACADDRHLGLLPLSTLLENIGGLFAPLLTGATVCLPPLASVGLSGSSGIDARVLLAALDRWRASTAILVPQMLQALVAAIAEGAAVPATLRYLAVGGAPLSLQVLRTARDMGLPVYEGYGLSECASVVAVNRPGDNRPGSVGRPLPHLRLAFADDGEILVHGMPWRGYLGAGTAPGEEAVAGAAGWIATGDLGLLDGDGYLYIVGRKRDVFITSFGRNVAPEWVESELTARAPIRQAAVFGEARPFNCAVIVASARASNRAIAAAVAAANRDLPDYARVQAWLRADTPFTPANGLATANGRLRRSHIFARHARRIDALYQPLEQH